MKWSKYSRLFQSKRNGWLLYSSASGSFLKLEDAQAKAVQEIMNHVDTYDFSECPQLYILLRSMGFLVEDSQDDDLYNILKMKRLTTNYAGNTLLLTVAITRACNFDCSYCYEGNRSGKPMSEEVEEKLIAFIKRFKTQNLALTWYGGEPLVAFDRILSIDRKIKEMGKEYSASLITNGYLLTEDVIGQLNELKINFIQITLDGNQATHDSRRYLKNRKGTFDTILKNLDALMASDYKGVVRIRVNVDARNEDEYIDVYRLMKERYPADYGNRIAVYPGFVKGDEHPDVSCFFDSYEKGEFIAKTMREHDVQALSLYPQKPPVGCTLTKRNAYVVGPDGELYKCWDDVGEESLVVGHIDSFTDWNMPLIAEGMVAASYLDSKECKECYYFPVCDGGCHKARMKNLHDCKCRDVCSYFKDHLEELLELHYEQKYAGTTDHR